MVNSVATEILKFVFQRRRLASPEDPCAKKPCNACFAPHSGRVESALRRNKPIEFVVLAFPAKSPNPRKVLGRLPDHAERLALESLQSFCEQVSHYHPPGGRLTICSDGHVFGSIVSVRDEDVSEYRRELERVQELSGCDRISFFALEDAFGAKSFDAMRDELESGYAETVTDLRKRVIADVETCRTFGGIHRFLIEDQSVLHPDVSRNTIRQECKRRAYELLRRSNAWSRLVAEAFSDAVRLSIHPQSCHAEKIGFQLLCSSNNWLTPWHGVAVEAADGPALLKRREAEQLGATLVRRNGRPSHFVAPHVQLKEYP